MVKLVAVNGEPVPEATLADEIEDFADNLEEDAIAVVSAVVLSDGTMRIAWFGDDYNSYELIGLFEAAKLRVIADGAE
jgi:hypothetical protein